MTPLRHYREVWSIDFEYQPFDGDHSRPICVAGVEHHSQRVIKRWLWNHQSAGAVFPDGDDVLFVTFAADAEMGCYLQLGWEFPSRLIDLRQEAKARWNGRGPYGNGKLPKRLNLIYLADVFGVAHAETAHKEAMQRRCIDGGPFTRKERQAILDYCVSDVVLTDAVLEKMVDRIDFAPALFRGRYMQAVTRVEASGVRMPGRSNA